MLSLSVRQLGVAAGLCASLLAAPLYAQDEPRPTDALLDLMRLTETVEIMRAEGLDYAATLADDMLPGPPGGSWDATLARIHDAERMEEIVRAGFFESFSSRDVNTDALSTFFASETGRSIIGLEISAREAMTDSAVEEAAREAYLDATESDGPEAARLAQIDEMVADHDLIEANVVGGMNSSVRFYQGLVDGGALEMGEGDILAEVWASEDEARTDTTEWIYGYLYLAYGPLSDSDMRNYVDRLDTPEGRALNTALFAGFDEMFSEISYALGVALALEMRVEEL